MYNLRAQQLLFTARARRGDTSTAVPCYGSGEVANEGLRHKETIGGLSP